MDEIFGRGQRVRAEVVSHHEDPVPRNKGRGILEQDSYTSVRFVNLTRQGVRDLNGPHGNGTGYNGRRDATCMHKRDPQAVAKYTKPVLVAGIDRDGFDVIVTKYMSCCMVCDTELGLADSFG